MVYIYICNYYYCYYYIWLDHPFVIVKKYVLQLQCYFVCFASCLWPYLEGINKCLEFLTVLRSNMTGCNIHKLYQAI